MSKRVSESEVRMIRRLRSYRRTTTQIAALMQEAFGYTRDDTITVIDACTRHQNNGDAISYANRVFTYQAVGIPLINGKPCR